MPLKVDLKPFERCIVGGASIRNGSRRTSLTIETATKFLREADILPASEANTPCKRLYLALEVMYLSDDPAETENAFVAQANLVMQAAPSTKPFILAIHDCLADRDHYRALKRGKELVAYETALHARYGSSEASAPEPAGA